MGLTNAVAGSLKNTENKIDNERIRVKDKADRATVENCLDPRTMKEIEKMLANQKIDVFSGCISTGKEANVYMATGTMDIAKREPFPVDETGNIPVKEYAVKVFKTSILVFKDRERYVSGEFRFRNGHCKGNPRKMVGLWAEKEVRNLKRIGLTEGLIRVPVPHILKNNIIVMDFVGEKGVAAPRLRDAAIEDWRAIYDQTILMIRRLYQRCKLVHADLSEYNLLYHQGEIWIIDVSQSVEHDHPMALDFLRRDCSIINDFFDRKKLNVLGI
jgi:RIO kinase 1